MGQQNHWQQAYFELSGLVKYSYLTNHKLESINHDKPVLVCLHGWLDNAASFIPVSAYLNDYQIILIELAGHGFSEHRPADSHYHLIDWVYDLWRIFETLPCERFNLIGHSMGGMLASILASLLPHKIDTLVLLESSAAFTTSANDLLDNMQAAFNSRAQLEKNNLTASPKRRNLAALPSLIQARANTSEISPELASLLIERNIKLTEQGFIWRSDPRLKTLSPIRLDESQALAYIQNIKADCLAILGDVGYTSINDSLTQRAHSFRNLHINSVMGGHHCHMQSPKQTADLIRLFIR
ncbi:alpha/beta fold hydrolase [Catenovulum adriaticum]|uniref:Alpha/beta hydrolase n=1 Tax=Catenovulum adriaticum TaxID=2984846 RepID=A0ABY7AK12_9ALTE|nr:alpha/beta hydrolase [Catenovulum sp. TS8]WAJ69087.1 alpha/beta hydrolase [Catenovulum sp. TS8]